MNKQSYLNRLQRKLRRLPESERRDMLADFEEHFDAGMEKGLTEEAISVKLGDPKVIARELSAEFRITAAERLRSFSSMLSAVRATMSINLKAVIGLLPVAGLLIVFVLSILVPASLIVSPVMMLATMPFYDGADIALYLSLSLIFVGLGALGAVGLYRLGKKLAGWALGTAKRQFGIARGGGRLS